MLKKNYDAKITEIEGKIPDVSGLATKTALGNAENKIPDVSDLVKKQIRTLKLQKLKINLKIIIMINILLLQNLIIDVFNARLSRANLVAKTNFDNTISSLDSKIAENKTKNESIQNELKKIKTLDLGYFIGKNYFEEDGAQNYLVFQPIIRCFKVNTIVNVADYILSWQSKGLSAENIKPPTTSDNSLKPTLSYYYASKIRVKLTDSSL